MRDSNSEPNQVWKWDLQSNDRCASRFFRLAKSLWNQGSVKKIFKSGCDQSESTTQIWVAQLGVDKQCHEFSDCNTA
jgi:hypothetical protein